jgi:hypothetical protein
LASGLVRLNAENPPRGASSGLEVRRDDELAKVVSQRQGENARPRAITSMNGPALTARAKTLIAANSEMAALIRAFDWARTLLGPIEGWSAMPTGGVLAISVEHMQESEDGIRLTMQDDGVGIAADDLPKVFDAFFTTRTTVGTGIGLFVAKQFVEGHGGRIDIESRNRSEDQGTAVRVFLPISTAYDAPDN